MEINLQGGVKPQALPGARSADFPVRTKATNTGTASVPEATIPQTADIETKRLERVTAAADSYFKDIFAVSDARFTIYKDTSGQYITRYTSLRDGRVTYIPEPTLLQYSRQRTQVSEALVEIQA